MCLKVITHGGMLHDVRPTIQLYPNDPSKVVINPYATPKECRCDSNSEIKSFLKCIYHDCCRTCSRIFRCNAAKVCDEPIHYHKYEARRSCNMLNGERTAGITEAEGWYPFPVVDGYIGDMESSTIKNLAHQSNELMSLRKVYTDLCSSYLALKETLINCENGLDIARMEWNSAEHDVCRRVLNPGECPEERSFHEAEDIYERISLDLVKLMTHIKLINKTWDQMRAERDQGCITGFDAYE